MKGQRLWRGGSCAEQKRWQICDWLVAAERMEAGGCDRGCQTPGAREAEQQHKKRRTELTPRRGVHMVMARMPRLLASFVIGRASGPRVDCRVTVESESGPPQTPERQWAEGTGRMAHGHGTRLADRGRGGVGWCFRVQL